MASSTGRISFEDLDRVIDGLVIGYARQQVALLGRAQDHERAAEVAGRLGQRPR